LKRIHHFVLTSVALACSGAALAQDNAVLRAAAQKAIASNPEVTARLNAFRATRDEVDVAKGGLLPKVDLGAELGRTRDTIEAPSRTPPETQSLSRGQLSITATQLLWDGQATRREVARLGHAKKARYFDFLDASEQTALEAARAYHDVQRFRRLVQLAEDNYVQHKYVETQVQSRVRAGVGRGVDSEQAVARLALAESNLVTEMSNLHDVSERYRRIVGDAPPPNLPAVRLDGDLPASSAAAIGSATSRSAAVAAAIENLRAVKEQAAGIKGGAFQPKVEARIRGAGGNNLDGVRDQKREIGGEIAMNWNLYNGGADQARVRQYANLINQAADLRDKACRDARQTAAIAYNDVAKLQGQIDALRRNESAIARARDAYRQQFDIGQRSLLDLLNAENELYTARRALSAAEYDLAVAQARSHAASATLVQRLGLTKAGDAGDDEDVKNWQAQGDEAARCPAEPGAVVAADKAALDARAMQMVGTPAPPPPPRPAAAPVAPPAAPQTPADFAAQRLNDWVAAWNSKQVSRYMGFYSKDFRPSKSGGRAAWLSERRRLVGKRGPIEVTIGNIETKTLSPTRAETEFDQNYKSNDYSDRMRKALSWERIGNEWYIVRESNR
jgi:adhesin transport system outer membrane protein